MTAEEMRILSSSNLERQNKIKDFISQQEESIRKEASRGRRRCSWHGDWSSMESIADECQKYFEERGFIIKDPHEYCGGVLQVGNWIYW